MIDLKVFISCGDDRSAFRTLGVRVIDRLSQFLVTERGGPFLFNWDYRNDLPRDVPAGDFERRSLQLVDESQILIGVLGATVPALTRKEILRAYQRQTRGERMRAYVLADPALTSDPHRRLLAKVHRDYRRDVQYGHYHTREDFLHQMYRTLFRYLLEHGGPPLGGGIT
jgi:hypothetical protein